MNTKTDNAETRSLHLHGSGSLTPGAIEALRLVFSVGNSVTCKKARELVTTMYGEAVSAELKAFFSDSTTDHRELPPPTMPKNTTASYGG